MSYETKDIDFLEQLFSEKALIIVGTVVKQLPQEGHYLPADQIRYNIKTKQQYLDRLRRIFKANKKIEVRYSDFLIRRHPTDREFMASPFVRLTLRTCTRTRGIYSCYGIFLTRRHLKFTCVRGSPGE